MNQIAYPDFDTTPAQVRFDPAMGAMEEFEATAEHNVPKSVPEYYVDHLKLQLKQSNKGNYRQSQKIKRLKPYAELGKYFYNKIWNISILEAEELSFKLNNLDEIKKILLDIRFLEDK